MNIFKSRKRVGRNATPAEIRTLEIRRSGDPNRAQARVEAGQAVERHFNQMFRTSYPTPEDMNRVVTTIPLN